MCTWNREILNGLEMPQGRGMPFVRFENSTAYLGSWIQKLENDPRMIISAASQAQRGSDFIMASVRLTVSKTGSPIGWSSVNLVR